MRLKEHLLIRTWVSSHGRGIHSDVTFIFRRVDVIGFIYFNFDSVIQQQARSLRHLTFSSSCWPSFSPLLLGASYLITVTRTRCNRQILKNLPRRIDQVLLLRMQGSFHCFPNFTKISWLISCPTSPIYLWSVLLRSHDPQWQESCLSSRGCFVNFAVATTFGSRRWRECAYEIRTCGNQGFSSCSLPEQSQKMIH